MQNNNKQKKPFHQGVCVLACMCYDFLSRCVFIYLLHFITPSFLSHWQPQGSLDSHIKVKILQCVYKTTKIIISITPQGSQAHRKPHKRLCFCHHHLQNIGRDGARRALRGKGFHNWGNGGGGESLLRMLSTRYPPAGSL